MSREGGGEGIYIYMTGWTQNYEISLQPRMSQKLTIAAFCTFCSIHTWENLSRDIYIFQPPEG